MVENGIMNMPGLVINSLNSALPQSTSKTQESSSSSDSSGVDDEPDEPDEREQFVTLALGSR